MRAGAHLGRQLAATLGFALVCSAPAWGQLLSLSPQQATVGSICFATVRGQVADLDGNGFPDVILQDDSSCGELRVMMNPGQVGVTAPAMVGTITGPANFTRGFVTDLNQDGHPDYLRKLGAGIYAYLNLGPGALVVQGLTNVSACGQFFVGDLDGDGVDEVIAEYVATPTSLQVWTNALTGLGTTWIPGSSVSYPSMQAATPLGTGFTLGLADVNGDGFLDVVGTVATASQTQRFAVVFLHTGNLTFGPPQLTPIGQRILAVGDVDHDGFADIVTDMTLVGGSFAYTVHWGAATQPFAASTPVFASPTTANSLLTSLSIVDLDSDGVPDLVETNPYIQQYPATPACGTRVTVYRGLGNRQFSAPWSVADVQTGTCPPPFYASFVGLWPVFGDFDGDGDIDILLCPDGATAPFRYLRNDSHFGMGAAGVGGLAPLVFSGTPMIGNGAFVIGLSNANPNSVAVLGLSVLRDPTAASNGILLDFEPAAFILPYGNIGITITNAIGQAMVPLPLPNNPALVNLTGYAQWGVADPLGLFMTPSGPFALTQGHTFVLR